MITFEHHVLTKVPEMHKTFVKIADEYGIHDHERNINQVASYSRRGVNCVVAKDGEDVVGVSFYGQADKFIDWTKQLPLKLHLSKRDIKAVGCATFIYARKDLLKSGVTANLLAEFCQGMLDMGLTHTMLWGYATDELASFSFTRPGSEKLEGFRDLSGRQVGIRDLKVFTEAWKAKKAAST